jgi:hypothetical protein
VQSVYKSSALCGDSDYPIVRGEVFKSAERVIECRGV